MQNKTIGELCNLVNGRAFKPSEWSNDGLPIIRIQNLNDKSKPFNYYSGEYDKKHFIKDGDLLFSWSGTPGTSFGAFFWNRGGALLNQHIFNVLIKNEAVYDRYFQYAMNDQLQHIIDQSHGGVGLKHITKGKLEAVQIPLPPLEEQRRIVEILDAAQTLIDQRKEQIDLMDQLVQSLFYDMFGDPVTNPMGWPVVKLKDAGSLKRGKSKHRPRNDPKLLGGEYPLIQTGNISNAGLHIYEYNQTYSELGLKQSRMWSAGTLCITIAANIAKTTILGFDACFPDSVVAFLPTGKSNNMYIQFWFGFLQRVIEASAPESAQKNINLKILENLDVPLPPITLQTKFASRVEKIEAHKAAMKVSLSELEDTFNALMQRAFKGEL